MRITTAALSALALTVGLVAPAAAHPTTAVLPPLGVDLTHAATDNVGFVARFHEHFGAAGGIKTSNEWNDGAEFFVVTDPRGVYTYDLTDPEAPVQLDMELINQGSSGTGAALAQEDPSTDGRLLLVDGLNSSGTGTGLNILNIEDPTDIKVVGKYTSSDHTWTCVSDQEGNGCAYAYGRSDNIIDIRDPAAPKKITPGWKAATAETGYAHDLTEIRPGLVMHAGAQPVLMDTTDPEAPVLLSHITLFDHKSPNDNLYPTGRKWSTFGYHSVEWANEGNDDFLIMGTELAPAGTQNNAGSDCNSDQAVIESWDARPVLAAFAKMDELKAAGKSHAEARTAAFGDGKQVKFIRLDSYMAAERGIFLEGKAAGHALYCAHWMEPNPSWSNGGTLAVGYYNRGLRFVDVDSDGIMSERGWFVGADAYTGSAQWINDETVYVMDYARGMDIVNLAPAEATGTYSASGSVSENAMTIAEMDAMGIAPPAPESGNSTTLVALGAALAAAAVVRRRRVAVEA